MAAPAWHLEVTTRPHTGLRVKNVRGIVAICVLAVLASTTLAGSISPSTAEKTAWTPRSLPGASIDKLDSFSVLPRSSRPRSSEPLGGIVFVRCTRLWSALPDGSSPSRVLEMDDISSPTFSPDAQTIAFLRHGREIWMASADGRHVKRVGTLQTEGHAIEGAVATSLTWSPDGRHLAFALMSPGHDMWAGGGSIWKLDIRQGNIIKQGSGWPAPTWRRKQIVFSSWDGEHGALLETGHDRDDRKLSREGVPYSAAFNNGSWWSLWDRGTVVLKEVDAELVLGYRGYASQRRDRLVIRAPSGFGFTEHSRPALSQDIGRIAVDMIGHTGNAAAGIYDLRTQEWTILDYAWDPTTSPAPTIVGPLGSRRAVGAANDLLRSAPRRTRQAQLLSDGAIPRGLFPNKGWGNYMIRAPRRAADGWLVPASVHGPWKEAYGYRDLDILVAKRQGRLTAKVSSATPIVPITTVTEAAGYLRHVLPHMDIPTPVGYPEGASLDPRYPVSAYASPTFTHATIRLHLPDGGRHDFLTFGYGDVSFSVGCGSANDIEEEEVDGGPALSGRSGTIKQVLWPATRKAQDDATYTVFGTLPRDRLVELARAQ